MRRGGASLLAAGMLLVVGPLAAQGAATVTVVGPSGNPTREGMPLFTITTAGFQPSDLPLQLTLQVSTRADFTGTLFADTTVAGVTSAQIVVPRLLPEITTIWWRARVRTAQGSPLFSAVTGPVATAPRISLITPNNRNGSTVDTRRPTFLWTSVSVRPPLAPWSYQLLITRAADGTQVPVFRTSPFDTVYTSTFDLESNTPYRWTVIGKLATGDSTVVKSFSTFVILDPSAPVATVLYAPFPNPFPNARVAATCIWFDLRVLSPVTLEILDIRGNRVAKLLPGRGLGPLFPASRYGRAAVGSDSGCDERLTWDGTDESGRVVPPGVYVIRFQGDGNTTTQRVLFRGR